MKLPRDLSGREVAAALVRRLEYRVVHESHIVLETDTPSHQRIAIPDHKSLRVGTLNAIFRAVAPRKHVEKDAITSLFSGDHSSMPIVSTSDLAPRARLRPLSTIRVDHLVRVIPLGQEELSAVGALLLAGVARRSSVARVSPVAMK